MPLLRLLNLVRSTAWEWYQHSHAPYISADTAPVLRLLGARNYRNERGEARSPT
jgi:hypothetical protein